MVAPGPHPLVYWAENCSVSEPLTTFIQVISVYVIVLSPITYL